MASAMHLLGWKVQEDPEKTHAFSCRFQVSGVIFNCEGISGGAFLVGDKPGRVESALEILACAVTMGALSPPLGSTLKGRLQYTRSQTFGRAGAPGLQALTLYESGQPWKRFQCKSWQSLGDSTFA